MKESDDGESAIAVALWDAWSNGGDWPNGGGMFGQSAVLRDAFSYASGQKALMAGTVSVEQP